VDSDSLIITSAGNIASGIFSFVMIFFLIGVTSRINYEYEQDIVSPESPTPYIKEANQNQSQKIILDFKPNKRERNYHRIILEAGNRYDVDPALIKAVIMAESGYDPKAVSKKGALGLMQLMPGTADELELEDPFDPFHNVNAGVKYLKGLLNEFEGDLELAIAAYNAGSKKVREFNGIPPYKTTRNYVKKVFQYYRYYQNSKV
jgi:soluble lytic murein transglycosylase-like protein